MYIMSRIDQDLSPWTLKKERSALSMLIGERLEIDLPKRERADITRSREPVEVDKHFSSEKIKMLYYSQSQLAVAALTSKDCDIMIFIIMTANYSARLRKARAGEIVMFMFLTPMKC